MTNNLELWDQYASTNDDFEPDDGNYLPSRDGKLLYEFLKLSPSVETARLYLSNQLDRYRDREYIPSDLERVVQSCIDLRLDRPMATSFKSWWVHYGAHIFGKKLVTPNILKFGEINLEEKLDDTVLTRTLLDYKNGAFTETGASEAMLIAVPLMGDKKSLMKSFEQIINAQTIQPVQKDALSNILVGERLPKKALRNRLHVLWMRGLNPEQDYKTLGADAGISNKYPNWDVVAKAMLDPNNTNIEASIEKHTIGALMEAVNTVENAARGRYPLHSTEYLPDDYNYHSVLKWIIQNIQYKKMRKKLSST